MDLSLPTRSLVVIATNGSRTRPSHTACLSSKLEYRRRKKLRFSRPPCRHQATAHRRTQSSPIPATNTAPQRSSMKQPTEDEKKTRDPSTNTHGTNTTIPLTQELPIYSLLHFNHQEQSTLQNTGLKPTKAHRILFQAALRLDNCNAVRSRPPQQKSHHNSLQRAQTQQEKSNKEFFQCRSEHTPKATYRFSRRTT